MLHVCIFVTTSWGWLIVAYELIVFVSGRKSKKDDTFGMKDEDWNVYKAIVSHQFHTVKQSSFTVVPYFIEHQKSLNRSTTNTFLLCIFA